MHNSKVWASMWLLSGTCPCSMVTVGSVPDTRLFTASYFIDNTRFIEMAAAFNARRDELKSKWNVPPGAVCFCFAGKLEPKKRILDLLAALRLAIQQSPRPMHLLVVGS